MTDSQVMTLALSIVIPVSLMLYSNSRVSDIRNDLKELEKRLNEKIDNAFEHMKLLLELHVERHHK
jgi:hypothetical protein